LSVEVRVVLAGEVLLVLGDTQSADALLSYRPAIHGGEAMPSGVKRAAKTLRQVDWVEVHSIRGHVDGDEIANLATPPSKRPFPKGRPPGPRSWVRAATQAEQQVSHGGQSAGRHDEKAAELEESSKLRVLR
jgi:hypothetical protein